MTTALTTATSGHCGSVSSTTTNFIGWFDEEAPEVRLSFAGERVDSVSVLNPDDRAADGKARRLRLMQNRQVSGSGPKWRNSPGVRQGR